MKPTTKNGPTYSDLMQPLRQLLVAMYAYFRGHLRLGIGLKELLVEVRRIVDGMTVAADLTWKAAQPVRFSAAKRPESLHQPIRVVATLVELREPQLVALLDQDGKPENVATISARFVDLDGETIWTLDVTEPGLIDKINEQWRIGGHAEVLGVPVALAIHVDRKAPDWTPGTSVCAFFLHVLDLKPSSSSLDFLGATTSERAATAALLEELNASGGRPLDFLLDRVVQGLNVVGLDTFSMLEDILEFTSLQAVSVGAIDQAPARLHGLIVGPPGQGKKLAGLAAGVLNPVCSELSAAKISPAGLVGATHSSADGWVSSPGAIPRAAGGVAIIQDAHAVSDSILRRVAPVLQEVMEDGVVRDSVAAGRKRKAPAALLMDLNRVSQLSPGGRAPAGAREAGFLRIRPLLSRFDAIFEIPEDVPRAWEVAGQMYASIQSIQGALDQQPWVRKVKLVVAALRDRHPVIDLDPVRARMKAVHEQIQRVNAEAIRQIPEASDVPIRMAISFARLVAAAARMRDASIANDEDVDVAVKFLNYKLDFLKFNGAALGAGSTDSSGAMNSREWTRRYAGQEVRVKDARQQYQIETGQLVSERTMRRCLIGHGGKPHGKGTYVLPACSDPADAQGRGPNRTTGQPDKWTGSDPLQCTKVA